MGDKDPLMVYVASLVLYTIMYRPASSSLYSEPGLALRVDTINGMPQRENKPGGSVLYPYT